MEQAQQHLTYMRPDGAIGVGYFIPWAGRYVHSVAWPDLPAERYSVERLERMRVQVLGIETVGKDQPEDQPETTPGVTAKPDLPTTDDESGEKLTNNRLKSDQSVSEAQAIRDFLDTQPEATNKEVIAALNERGIEVSSGQVSRERRRG